MGTFIVGAIVAAIVIAAVVKMIRNKKSGKTSCGCGCGCSGCSSAGLCSKDFTDLTK